MATAIAIVSDLHTNCKTALRCPSIKEDDGGTSRASKSQRWLWYNWLEFWDTVGEMKVDRRIAIINGECIDIDYKSRSKQHHFVNTSDAENLAIATLEPVAERVDAMYFTRGTEAHVGGSGEYEEKVAKNFDNTIPDPGNNTYSWWHIRAKCENVRIDAAHHVTGGRLPWTEKNAANKLAAITIYNYIRMRQPPPHLVTRGHIHRYSDSGNNYDDTFAVITPSWQLLNSYAYRIGAENSLSDIGGCIYICDDGDLIRNKPTLYRPITSGLWKTQI